MSEVRSEIQGTEDADDTVPPTDVFRVAGSSVIDAWTGYTIVDRCDASIEGLLRIARRAGRPIDVEVGVRSWFRIWPDGCQAAIREPASMARKRELDKRRCKATRRLRRKARRRETIRRITRPLTTVLLLPARRRRTRKRKLP